MILLAIKVEKIGEFYEEYYESLFIGSQIAAVATLLPLICSESLRFSSPTNYIVLGIFTIAESIAVSMASYIVKVEVGGEIVLQVGPSPIPLPSQSPSPSPSPSLSQALIITTFIVLSLTLWTLQSSCDFSHWGGFLFAALFALIAAGIVQIFVPFSSTVEIVMSCCVALVFSLFLIYDTYMINKRLSTDEYIVGALELYLDAINLFLYILQILSNGRQ